MVSTKPLKAAAAPCAPANAHSTTMPCGAMCTACFRSKNMTEYRVTGELPRASCLARPG